MTALLWQQHLLAELDHWHANREVATFWWRDDDAQADSAALRQLLALSAEFKVAVALAVIPKGVRASLAPLVATANGEAAVEVLVHGYAHVNRAAPGEKKQELYFPGAARGSATAAPTDQAATAAADELTGQLADELTNELTNELTWGWRTLRALFGARALPIMVPPWNRIDPAYYPLLIQSGYRGLSTYTPRHHARIQCRAGTLWQVNTHIDVIDWKAGRSFVGEAAVVEQILRHLRARRLRECDHTEPSGLLTHHLQHDAATWRFLPQLFGVLRRHPAVNWLSAKAAFGLAERSVISDQ